MIRSFSRIQNVDPGFTPDHLLTLQLSMAVNPDQGEKVLPFFTRVLDRIKELPGVKSAAFSNGLPFAGASETSFEIEGRPKAKGGEEGMSVLFVVTVDYFKTMGIHLIKGRLFTEQERKA
jgi:putative ABC transport system permease protein